MDQDFHFYGTYYAARQGGFSKDDSTLIAKASNFIDFFNEHDYAAYWKLVRDTQKSTKIHQLPSGRFRRLPALHLSGEQGPHIANA